MDRKGYDTIQMSSPVLATRAGAVLRRVASIETHFRNLDAFVKRSSGYWEGKAGETHRRLYQTYSDDIQDLIERFRRTSAVLEKIAVNYETAERAAGSETGGLPTDVIV